jgi:hypothetical protein
LRKSHDIGLKPGILDRKHIDAMGMSVWLYAWIILHQTQTTGFVHGGAVITYALIQEELDVPCRTLRRWMKTLQRGGYIEVTYSAYKRMRIRVEKSKKFNHRQHAIQFPESIRANSGRYIRPDVAQGAARNGPFNKSSKESSIEPYKAEEAAAAFSCIGFDEPFGQPPFQKVFLERMAKRNGDWLTMTMEATIQECQRKKIGIPPQFYSAKRSVESLENAEAAAKYKRTPL